MATGRASGDDDRRARACFLAARCLGFGSTRPGCWFQQAADELEIGSVAAFQRAAGLARRTLDPP